MGTSLPSLDACYQAHGDAVYGYVMAMADNAADADDAFQQTWLTVQQRLAGYQERGRLRSWLLTIARNALIDLQRRKRRQAQPSDLDQQATHAADPMQQLAGTETADAMQAAIAGLSDKLREVYCLRVEQDLSYDDIAAMTGEPKSRLVSRLHLALKELRAAWQAHHRPEELRA